jgi:predicted RNase H-like HicB family nuclease
MSALQFLKDLYNIFAEKVYSTSSNKGKLEYTLEYPARFEQVEEGFVISFRNIPSAITQSKTLSQGFNNANDCLETALDFYMERQQLFPLPSIREESELLVILSPELSKKIWIYNAQLGLKLHHQALKAARAEALELEQRKAQEQEKLFQEELRKSFLKKQGSSIARPLRASKRQVPEDRTIGEAIEVTPVQTILNHFNMSSSSVADDKPCTTTVDNSTTDFSSCPSPD